MVRRKCDLLIVSCLCLSAGCIVEVVDEFIPEPSLPIAVHAQDSWGEEPIVGTDGNPYPSEREIVFSCVQEWNDQIAPRLKEGEPLPLEFAGFTADPDFKQERDLLDGRTVIYKIPVITPDIQEMLDAARYPGIVAGYGLFGSDALVFRGKFADFIGPDTRPDAISVLLRHVVCHELGHVLGIQHQFVLPGVMNDIGTAWYSEDEAGHVVRQADVDGFCLAHPDSCQ